MIFQEVTMESGQASIWLEIAKIAAPFVAAALALAIGSWRFRSERRWEKRLLAYVDAVAALREMRSVRQIEYNAVLLRRELSDQNHAELAERYRAARNRLNEATAAALLLFTKRESAPLVGLEEALRHISETETSYEGMLDHELAVLKRGLDEVGRLGQRALR
ncbi:hypothetical protein ACAX61_03680 [Sphingomonas sp. IW22]